MKKVTAYKCDFCTEISTSKADMKSHEDKCTFSPKIKSCGTCANFWHASHEHFEPCLGGVPYKDVEKFWLIKNPKDSCKKYKPEKLKK